MTTEQELFDYLQPVAVGQDRFRGESLPGDHPAIYGGQLMAQVLSVAAATLPEPRPAHYLQTSFVSFGDPSTDLEFEVTRVRDGRSTSHRQVEVKQGDRTLLVGSLSFQPQDDGYDHQLPRPDMRGPEELEGDSANYISFASPEGDFPFLIMECGTASDSLDPISSIWARPRMPVPADNHLHQMLFAFLSDATILQSSLQPHALDWETSDLFIATMNHSIWFHRPLDINGWLLLHGHSPSTSHGRALSIADAWDSRGGLVATVAQEGILRHNKS